MGAAKETLEVSAVSPAAWSFELSKPSQPLNASASDDDRQHLTKINEDMLSTVTDCVTQAGLRSLPADSCCILDT